MISESYSNNLAVSDPALKDTAAAKYVDIIGGHLYGGGPNPYPLAESLNKQYWETENSGMGGPNENIDDGIKYANIVHKCLAKCNMNAYHYWWLVNNNGDDEGLCNSSGKPTLRMYTIGNFSKFIRPGFVRVDATAAPATGITVSAYHGVSRGQLVIVAINSGSAAGKLDFTIAGFSGASTAGRWLTDNTHKLERQEPVAISGNAFSNELPAKSVTTFVVWNGITAVKGITPQPRKASPRLALQAGNRQIEMPSAYTAWTMQVLSLDGRELSRTTIPSGQRIATIGAREYSGIVVVKVQQGSMKKAFFVVQP
jgi:glucuronoarabinoxylan endo-1,4-beta-xylanase